MTVRINANQFSLKYLPDEDRLLFSVAMSPEHELGVLLTRRLTRSFTDALCKHAPAGEAAAAAPAATQQQGAEKKEEPRAKTLAVPPRLVREIHLAPKENGDIAIAFDNGEQQLVLDVSANRIAAVTGIFLDLASRAGWNFTDIASQPAQAAAADLRGKVLH
jgi:hypothetical protein